ncbi:MAG: hypothetical protein LBP87_13505 [Planctomycetaceae bacterium]|jgi:hypothetical protein|nr:hypothetical protein [Planctomycetaceae bacterium]
MSITTTKTEGNSLKYQSDNFDANVNDAELINSLRPNDLKSDELLLFSSLPKKIQIDIRKSQQNVVNGQVVSDTEVFRKIDKWLENN